MKIKKKRQEQHPLYKRGKEVTDLLALVLVEGGEEEAPADGLLDVLQLGFCLRNYFLHTRCLLRFV